MLSMKINDICFDSENKEHVRISNGIEKDGVLVPTEAIAIRFIGMDNGKPILAFTYRKVDATKLSFPSPDNGSWAALFETAKSIHFSFIGRV